ncbi:MULTISPECIES: L-2-hydroxyglutarate oxidase [unclassified Microbacterium]|uniref:L-2-hydroxyglutarate oxidase n=1 Tax=unclassified Microbacterium TaxID=2609290 RepID=UPI003865DA0E
MIDHIVVVGAGIVGLATAHELVSRGHRVTVLEKEARVAEHQTGNNSGVIHSGLYYPPGSLKARYAAAGATSMRAFAAEHGVTVDICGKLVVATDAAQLGRLNALHERGLANGVPCRVISPEEAHEYEPHVRAVAALRVESTGIVDYRGVCDVLRRLIEEGGGEVRFGQEVTAISDSGSGVVVSTSTGEVVGDRLVNCAGLHSDRIARLAGMRPEVRIVPFRGEYFTLTPDAEHLVRGLVYPVPDPGFPFLGVHFTRMFDGSVHAGPNAVFALAREGYSWGRISPRDVIDSAMWPGLWRLGRRFWRTGIDETRRSLSKRGFTASLQELIPEIGAEHLTPAHAGVRAQAVRRDGTMVEDFHIERTARQVHVLNAPSPAATAAFEIGRSIADELAAASR